MARLNSEMTIIRAISLDVGGTLIEPYPSVGHVYTAAVAEHGARRFDPSSVTTAFLEAWKGRGDFDYSREAWLALVRATFAGGLEVSESLFDAIYSRFGRASAWRVHEDVFPFLEKARAAGVPLIAISNWDERLKPLLSELGLAPYFVDVIVSVEAGARKPDPLIFQAAAKRLGLPPALVLHAGDSRFEDFEGALNAGFQSLLLKRGEPPSDVQVATLEELFQRTSLD
jgi:putative hydrolase of the HAD superfamily